MKYLLSKRYGEVVSLLVVLIGRLDIEPSRGSNWSKQNPKRKTHLCLNKGGPNCFFGMCWSIIAQLREQWLMGYLKGT